MKFKISKPSPLFTELKALQVKIKEVTAASADLIKEMGFKEFRPAPFSLAGGISSVFAKTKPENYAYAFGPKEPNDFLPKKTKANAELIAKIKALPVVEHKELNSILKYDGNKSNKYNGRGGKTISFHPGIIFKKDHVLIDVPEYVDYKPVAGMTEITVSEYNKLYAKK